MIDAATAHVPPEAPTAITTATLPELAVGTGIDATFTCLEKRTLLTRKDSKPFIVTALADEHGTCKGTIFDDVEALAPAFDSGDLVRVQGHVREYGGRHELRIEAIDRLGSTTPPEISGLGTNQLNELGTNGPGPKGPETNGSATNGPGPNATTAGGTETNLNVADLSPELGRLPTATAAARLAPIAGRPDPEELDGYLEQLVREISDRRLKALLDALLANPLLRASWRRVPAAPGVHHAYTGGLLEHTVAVARLAQETAQLHPRLDADLLLAAGILHDIGRTEELSEEPPFAPTREGSLVGHLWLGAELIAAHARDLPDSDRIAELLHCVLHHHGPLAGSHVPRLSLEAVVLRRLCELDACAQAAPPMDDGPSRERLR